MSCLPPLLSPSPGYSILLIQLCSELVRKQWLMVQILVSLVLNMRGSEFLAADFALTCSTGSYRLLGKESPMEGYSSLLPVFVNSEPTTCGPRKEARGFFFTPCSSTLSLSILIRGLNGSVTPLVM